MWPRSLHAPGDTVNAAYEKINQINEVIKSLCAENRRLSAQADQLATFKRDLINAETYEQRRRTMCALALYLQKDWEPPK